MKKKNHLVAIFAVGLLAGPIAAQADYGFEQVDHPGAPSTQVFGINDRGDVVGNGNTNVASFPFVLAQKKGTLTDVAPMAGADTSVLGITDSGVMVGNVNDGSATRGFIRDKKGNFTVSSHPDDLFSFTSFRGVNNKGLVSGFYFRPDFDGSVVGFVYDPKSDTFSHIIPPGDHAQSIAHGMNSKGEAVGSAFFFGADDPCDDNNMNFLVRHGWRRAVDGTVTYFQVNGLWTAARGVNDEGSIAGFVTNPNGSATGFVVKLDGSQCQAITVDASDLLENDLGFDDTIPEGISNSGIVVGNTGTGNISHGFIARPD